MADRLTVAVVVLVKAILVVLFVVVFGIAIMYGAYWAILATIIYPEVMEKILLFAAGMLAMLIVKGAWVWIRS